MEHRADRYEESADSTKRHGIRLTHRHLGTAWAKLVER